MPKSAKNEAQPASREARVVLEVTGISVGLTAGNVEGCNPHSFQEQDSAGYPQPDG